MRYLVSLMLALAVASPAVAAFDGAQAVKDSASVKNAAEDRPAQLEGELVQQVAEDIYLFVDESGDVFVEIDDDILKADDVKPGSRVRLSGHVEKDDRSPYVEVDALEVLD